MKQQFTFYSRFLSLLIVVVLTSGIGYGQEGSSTVFKAYYSNGKLKSITHQGIVEGCGVPVGIDSVFDTRGNLSGTVTYVHVKEKEEEGCHSLLIFEKRVTYHRNGEIASIKYYGSAYEQEPFLCSRQQYEAARTRRKEINN
jgi:antitoxin component YwqK of YwqJK toxin-antitoxin module